MYLYKITNTINSTIYIGVTKSSLHRRFSAHKWAARHGIQSALYDAMRKHGVDNFKIDLCGIYQTEAQMLTAEEQVIKYSKAAKIRMYNIKNGGSKIFGIRDKAAWIRKLKEKRVGRTPSLGMKHSDENKKLFGMFGTQRWDKYGRYPSEVLDYGFTEANKKFGISKTHYYRLRKESGKV